MVNYTSIQVTTELRDKLKTRGMKGESYQDVISRLLEFYEKNYKSKIKRKEIED
jgi:hypothetical protein